MLTMSTKSLYFASNTPPGPTPSCLRQVLTQAGQASVKFTSTEKTQTNSTASPPETPVSVSKAEDPVSLAGWRHTLQKSIRNILKGLLDGASYRTTWQRLKQTVLTAFDGVVFYGAILLATWVPIPALRRVIEKQLLYAPKRVAIREDLRNPEFKKDTKLLKSVFFTASDLKDVPLHGWYIQAPKGRPTIVFTHGRGDNIASLEPVLEAAQKKGYGIFVFDYRGFGNSGGTPTETGVYKDLIAACKTLKSDYGVPYQDQILMGHSLGGAIATKVMSLKPDRFKGLVLLSTFNSMKGTLSYHRDQMKWVKWMFNEELIKSSFNSAAVIGKIKQPVLGFWGESDPVTPPVMGKQLWQKLDQSRTSETNPTFHLLPNTGHEITSVFSPENIDTIFSALDKKFGINKEFFPN
jgi:pimeloyl-ACP methyl ester carboxylesterase